MPSRQVLSASAVDGAPRDERRRRDARWMRARLLAWYDAGARALPWRVRPEDRAAGVEPDPYRVWLSEIMLQQTTVAAATPYYHRFLERFPSVQALAAAPLESVLEAWAGLGYYARARNLHACAQAVAAAGGRFPDTEEGLRTLPGVGAYTAAAVAAVCFDRPTNVVDGNVERVMARLHAVEAPLPGAKPLLRDLAAPLADVERPGDYAQALMDLGATVCVPRTPRCDDCPWADACAARASGAPEAYPRKTPKKPKPTRHGAAFVVVRDEAVWLRRRPAKGLLGAMAEPPGAPWRDTPWTLAEARAHAPCRASWREAETVRHVFSHFALTLQVWRGAAPARFDGGDGWWAPTATLEEAGLPSVMMKAVRAGLSVGDAPTRAPR